MIISPSNLEVLLILFLFIIYFMSLCLLLYVHHPKFEMVDLKFDFSIYKGYL